MERLNSLPPYSPIYDLFSLCLIHNIYSLSGFAISLFLSFDPLVIYHFSINLLKTLYYVFSYDLLILICSRIRKLSEKLKLIGVHIGLLFMEISKYLCQRWNRDTSLLSRTVNCLCREQCLCLNVFSMSQPLRRTLSIREWGWWQPYISGTPLPVIDGYFIFYFSIY